MLTSPGERFDLLHADVGLYAEDAWTLNRLTVNYGARFEHFSSGIPVETSPAGRFTAARTFGPIEMPTWTSTAPRGGVAYDLLGNQQTALQFTVAKYLPAPPPELPPPHHPL